MKKIILSLVLVLSLVSCSLDDGEESKVVYDKMSIVSVEAPDTLMFGKQETFKISFLKKTDCHQFYDIAYSFSENKHYITAIAFKRGEQCEVLEGETQEESFKISIQNREAYSFRFWSGVNEEGEDTFIEKEIPVVSMQQ